MQNIAGGSFPSSPHGQPPCPTDELMHNQAEDVDFFLDGEGGDALLHPCLRPRFAAAVQKNAGFRTDDENDGRRRGGGEGRAVKADARFFVINTRARIASLAPNKQDWRWMRGMVGYEYRRPNTDSR
jgi:hypothetical protein